MIGFAISSSSSTASCSTNAHSSGTSGTVGKRDGFHALVIGYHELAEGRR